MGILSRLLGGNRTEQLGVSQEVAPDPGETVPDIDEERQHPQDSQAVAEKIASLVAARWEPTQRDHRDRLLGIYHLAPDPISPGLRFLLEKGSTDMMVWDINLGDESLESRGIGTLLLETGALHALKENPELRTVSRHRGTTPFVRAMEKAFGEENVSYERPEHAPPEEDILCNIRAQIDRERLQAVDIPQKLGRLARTGHV
jgi:hypothetical protein